MLGLKREFPKLADAMETSYQWMKENGIIEYVPRDGDQDISKDILTSLAHRILEINANLPKDGVLA